MHLITELASLLLSTSCPADHARRPQLFPDPFPHRLPLVLVIPIVAFGVLRDILRHFAFGGMVQPVTYALVPWGRGRRAAPRLAVWQALTCWM